MFYVLCLARCFSSSPAVPFSYSMFVTSVHGHSGKVSVKEWFILQQYCYRPHEGDTSGVSDFFLWLSAEKTAPTRWISTSDQGPNPIREQYFHGGMKMAKVNLPSEVRFTAVPLFSQKKEVLLWYPLVVYLPVEVCIIPRWRNYPIAFPFISIAVSQLACDLSELRNLLIASLLTNFRHFFQTISLTINVM